MYVTTQNFTPLQTIFGGGYVPEQHSEETHRNLPPSEDREFVLDFDAVLKVMRAALSLR